MADLEEHRLVPLVPPTASYGGSGDIAWALDHVKGRQHLYSRYDRYYEGDHDLSFATEKFRNTFASLFKAFADNLCPAIVDALTDRLLITGWDGDLAEAAQELSQQVHFPLVANAVHNEAAKSGDGYVVVWPNSKSQVTMWPQRAWNCCVEYDDDYLGRVSKAAKVWVVQTGPDAGKWRITLYYRDRLERYISSRRYTSAAPSTDKSFEPYNGDGQGSSITNPYDIVPMFHFPNNGSAGFYGRSELKDVIPLQDALNKAVCDMLVAMEFVAMPQRYATGLQVEVDPITGKPRNPPFIPGVDRIWTAGEQVKFGEFQQANLKAFIDVQDSLRTESARVSGTPLHYLMLGTQFPSGESMRTAEARLIKKAEDRQISYSPPWTDAFALGLVIDGKASNVDETIKKFSPVWNNATPHNPLFDAETQLVKKQVGVSQRQALRELGYTDVQINKMEEENEEAAAQAMQKQIDQAKEMADMGGVPGSPRFGTEGKPTAFNRKAPPGQTSQPAPRQQQTRRPIKA